MAELTLYDYARSSAAYRVRIALNCKGMSYAQAPINLLEGAQRDLVHLARNPQGMVPALDTGAAILTQSLAILEWLEEVNPSPALLPAEPEERARVRAAALLIACDIHPLNNLRVLAYLKGPLAQPPEAVTTWYRHWISEGFAALESLVQGPRFCFGDQLSLADICLVPQMTNARRFETDLAPYPGLVAIDAYLRGLEAFLRAAPENQGA